MNSRLWVAFALIASVATAVGLALAAPPPARNFVAHLIGENEVPPVDTDAEGEAIFHFTIAGDRLQYQINVAQIENIVAAHIHLAPKGVNGPVVATLYGPKPPGEPWPNSRNMSS